MKVKFSKKALVLVIAAALLIALAVGGALAFLKDSADPVTNTFIPAVVDCKVVPGDSGLYTVQNVSGDTHIRAYIRAAVVLNTVDASGNITGNVADESTYLAADGWTKSGDYYYWDGIVEVGASTGNLLKAAVPAGVSVTVLAEAIQADGMPTSVANAVSAFAYAIANGGA
ncbi:MAG: hypothetical protein II784_01595 [Oscillospiraceae bacterium]|nr:hypothetical protein [Oscillospiraceae bacterium]